MSRILPHWTLCHATMLALYVNMSCALNTALSYHTKSRHRMKHNPHSCLQCPLSTVSLPTNKTPLMLTLNCRPLLQLPWPQQTLQLQHQETTPFHRILNNPSQAAIHTHNHAPCHQSHAQHSSTATLSCTYALHSRYTNQTALATASMLSCTRLPYTQQPIANRQTTYNLSYSGSHHDTQIAQSTDKLSYSWSHAQHSLTAS